jgi:TolA-binding protein
MNDLKLVSPEKPSALERHLLDAVANESPSAEQRARVRLALGLPAVAPAPIPVAPVGRRALMLKAAGGLIVVSAAVIALLSGSARKPSSAEQTAAPLALQPAIAASAIAAPVAAAPAIAEPVTGAPEVEAPIAPAIPADVGAPSKRARKAATLENGADLSEQMRLIDAARSAVAAGNAGAASAALTSYRTRFPRGPFGQEAAVLQIQTLDLQGNHAEARARARSFLSRHPNSPHVSVVQRIAGR